MDVEVNEGRVGHGSTNILLALDDARSWPVRGTLSPMIDRRRPLLVVVVVGFVAIVALVAHGRPLAANGGHGGVSGSFWSYVLTTTIILFAISGLVVLVVFFAGGLEWQKPTTSLRASLLRLMLALVSFVVIAAFLENHFHHLPRTGQTNPSTGNPGGKILGDRHPATNSGTHVVWLEVVIVFALLAIAVAIAIVLGRRKRESLPELPAAPEAVAEALDESLDDLRSDPDLRRAIVAAYARMEHALRAVGLPRRPAEAPLEYVERALDTLDTSAPSVRRLTDLFEWAKFSPHEPEESMRDEAVEALEAVRDELRATSADSRAPAVVRV
jgi:Domain of unknown function (DUF4129)